jgi:DNA-binding beta-propeller fold protein YncE
MAEMHWTDDDISRFWDGLSRLDPAPPFVGEGPDAGTAESVRQLHTMSRAAPPLKARARLDQAMRPLLMSASKMKELPGVDQAEILLLPEHRTHPNGAKPFAGPVRAHRRAPLHGRMRWVALSLAAALLLLLTGAGIYLFNDRHDDQPSAIPAAIQETPSREIDASDPATFVWETTGGSEPLMDPTDVTFDPQGNLWVTDGYNSNFQIFTPDGVFLETWGEQGSENGQFNLRSPEVYGAAAFDADGNLYVADIGNFRVQKFDSNREFVTAWGSEGVGDGQFQRLIDIAVDDQGRVLALDKLREDVQVFDGDGAFLFKFGRLGNAEGEFSGPLGLSVGLDGRVWVADIGNNRVQVFDKEGTFLAAYGEFGTGPGQMYGPHDVAVDKDGHVFVAEFHGDRIQVLGPDGEFLASWGEYGAEEGQFRQLEDVVLDDDGGVYTTDPNVNRVQKFELNYTSDAASTQDNSAGTSGDAAAATLVWAVTGGPVPRVANRIGGRSRRKSLGGRGRRIPLSGEQVQQSFVNNRNLIR